MLHTSFLHRETLSTCDAQLWLKQTPEHLSSVLILSCCFSVSLKCGRRKKAMIRSSQSGTRSKSNFKMKEEGEAGATDLTEVRNQSWKLKINGQAKRTQCTATRHLAILVNAEQSCRRTEITLRLRWSASTTWSFPQSGRVCKIRGQRTIRRCARRTRKKISGNSNQICSLRSRGVPWQVAQETTGMGKVRSTS